MSKVLIVDDDKDICLLAQSFIEQEFSFVETHFASGAFEAMETLSTHSFDLILTDITMPFKNGYQFVEALNYSKDLSPIPVAFLTSRNTNRDIQRALQLGACGFILKPFKKEQLVKKIHRLLFDNTSDKNILCSTHPCEVSNHTKSPSFLKIYSIFEAGLIANIQARQICKGDLIKLHPSFFKLIGIDYCHLKVSSAQLFTQGLNSIWKTRLHFSEISPSGIKKMRSWLSNNPLKKVA